MNIAFFDFDGTISFKDSFMNFLAFKSKSEFYMEFPFVLPFFIAYKLGFFKEQAIKNLALTLIYKNFKKEHFMMLCSRYASEVLPSILRPLALKRLKWHKDNGDKIVIVTASIEEYLKPWCDKNGFELIASKLEVRNNRITGRLFGANCHGDEKVRQIKEKYDLNAFEKIYAYGDTKGDLPMLSLANESFYKPFRD